MVGLRVGLIGAGVIGRSHGFAWRMVSSIFGGAEPRLVCLAGTDADRTEASARRLGFERHVVNWQDLVDDPEIDVVSIATPHVLHPAMAIRALEAGKHVWCEKPMGPLLDESVAMAEAARNGQRTAVLGYNYIQNPLIRKCRDLIAEGAVGQVHHIRIEMDEDFMADPQRSFTWRNELKAGYGVVDGFGTHQLSLLFALLGEKTDVKEVSASMERPFPSRPNDGGTREVESFDTYVATLRLGGGSSALLAGTRSAWGRKNRIFIQIFGSRGSIVFDQERMNELQIFSADGNNSTQGFRTILATPAHPPYGSFTECAGHQLGFNDLKVIECRELIAAIDQKEAFCVDFELGLKIERIVHLFAASSHQKEWVAY